MGLTGSYLLRELLQSLFADEVQLNLFGVGAIAAWSAVCLGSLVVVIRARRSIPSFRGISSELLRIVAVLQTCLVVATWAAVVVTGAYFSRGVVQELEHCERIGNVTRCELEPRLDE